MRRYTARRAGARWREQAPEYVLDCFDSKNAGERYTVMFKSEGGPDLGESWIPFLGMSGAPTHPQGVSMWGELKACEAAGYRYREGKHRVRWLDLPEHIRSHVVARYTQV